NEATDSTEPPHVTVMIDEDGDLILRARSPSWMENGTNCSFLVDSRALARASPVWKSMLYGGWAESKPTDGSQWVVSLPEDDPRALSHLLRIAHGKHNDPVENNVLVTFHTIILCDKYDTFRLIGPFLPHWNKVLSRQVFGPMYWHNVAALYWLIGDLGGYSFACHHILMWEPVVTSDRPRTLLVNEENEEGTEVLEYESFMTPFPLPEYVIGKFLFPLF
ncbi:hypothetical protein QBC35DRAFT_391767, partial [Podospora australis]